MLESFCPKDFNPLTVTALMYLSYMGQGQAVANYIKRYKRDFEKTTFFRELVVVVVVQCIQTSFSDKCINQYIFIISIQNNIYPSSCFNNAIHHITALQRLARTLVVLARKSFRGAGRAPSTSGGRRRRDGLSCGRTARLVDN